MTLIMDIIEAATKDEHRMASFF